MKISELSQGERPREKMLSKGAGYLSNRELLAVIISSGTRNKGVMEVAESLLELSGGGFTGLADLSPEELRGTEGIGIGKALTICATFEIARRFLSESTSGQKVQVISPRVVYDLMIPFLKGLTHEECWVVFLNRAQYVTGKCCISSGGMESTVIDTRVIIAKALSAHACGLVLVHNHPTGNPEPSREDIRQTTMLKEAASSMDLALVDHVIVCNDCYFSFSDNGRSVI